MSIPATQRFVAYYRVSTDQQGRSGLGLGAQREAVPATPPAAVVQRAASASPSPRLGSAGEDGDELVSPPRSAVVSPLTMPRIQRCRRS